MIISDTTSKFNPTPQLDTTAYTFVICPNGGKNPYAKNWQLPDHGLTYAQARAHRGNVGIRLIGDLICVDIDSNANDQLATLGNLAETTVTTRSNAPDRAALLYHVDVDPTELHTRKFRAKTRTDKSFDIEILTQSADGNAKHKLIAGTHKGGSYSVDHTYPIKRLSAAEYTGLIMLLTSDMIEATSAPVLRVHKTRQATPAASNGDISALITNTSCIDVFAAYGRVTKLQPERGETRLLKNGGLLVNEDKNIWRDHGSGIGGDALAAVAYCECGNIDTSDPDLFKVYVSKLADIAGVAVPTFGNARNRVITNPLTNADIKLDDVLDTMRRMVSEHRFSGRSRDSHRQVALAYIENFSAQGDATAHGSIRSLVELSGCGNTAVSSATFGRTVYREYPQFEEIPDPEMEDVLVPVFDEFGIQVGDRFERPAVRVPLLGDDGEQITKRKFDHYEGEALTDWLITKSDNAICGQANVWRIHEGVFEAHEKYALKQDTLDYSVDGLLLDPLHCSLGCLAKVHSSLTSRYMANDAFIRQHVPLPLRKPATEAERKLARVNPHDPKNGEYLKSFGPTGLAIVSQLAVESMSISQLANTLGHHRNVIRSAIKRLQSEPTKAGANAILLNRIDENDARVTIYSLSENWLETVRDITPHMYTHGATQRRKARHISERIEHLEKIIPATRNASLAEKASEILEAARKQSATIGTVDLPTPLPQQATATQQATAAATPQQATEQATTNANVTPTTPTATATVTATMLDRIMLAMPESARAQFVSNCNSTSDPAKWAAIKRLQSSDIQPSAARVAVSAIGNFYNHQIDWRQVAG